MKLDERYEIKIGIQNERFNNKTFYSFDAFDKYDNMVNKFDDMKFVFCIFDTQKGMRPFWADYHSSVKGCYLEWLYKVHLLKKQTELITKDNIVPKYVTLNCNAISKYSNSWNNLENYNFKVTFDVSFDWFKKFGIVPSPARSLLEFAVFYDPIECQTFIEYTFEDMSQEYEEDKIRTILYEPTVDELELVQEIIRNYIFYDSSVSTIVAFAGKRMFCESKPSNEGGSEI